MIFPLPESEEGEESFLKGICNLLSLLTLFYSFTANGALVIGVNAAVAAAQQIDVALLDQICGNVVLLEGHIAKVLSPNGVRAAVPALQMLMFVCCKKRNRI